MENKHIFIAIGVSAILSSACTAVAINAISPSNVATKRDGDASDIQSQIAQLQDDLKLESQARSSLQQQLIAYQRSEKPDGKTLQSNPNDQTQDQEEQIIAAESQQEIIQQFRDQRRNERLARQQPGYRESQLVKAGFEPEEAARIVQLESEQSLRQLQAQYDSRRELAQNSDAATNPIRTELGDQGYERYLEANGLPTSASIRSVISGSPGENAGLQPGDSITSYAGERVFSLGDVNNLTVRGSVGESVLIEVDRDGQPVQLTIPRGPIGINNGRRRFIR